MDNQKFNECIRNYLAEVVDYDQFVQLGLPFTNLWKDIGKYLLEPLEEHLKRIKVIYFIPHHILHYLPFHALELNGIPLIKNYGVVYLQSATLLEFYNDRSTKSISCSSIGVYKGNEESFFHKEAKAIAGIYHTTALIDAPKSEILQNMNKDLLHFATHGKYNHQDPMDSEITLNENERLTVREIFGLNLNLDLVTISACESGFNKYHPGDELTGLARAFTYAGARSMVISLWKVYDPSTYEFMLRFYRNMNGGMNKVSALQDAQISLMEYKKYSHPHFWAPFILIGNSK